MHSKVFVQLKKNLKPSRPGKKTQKNPKKPKKTQKTQKNPKKPTGLGFFKKTRVFSNPDPNCCIIHLKNNTLLQLHDLRSHPPPLPRALNKYGTYRICEALGKDLREADLINPDHRVGSDHSAGGVVHTLS